jgi:hypothetical protein
VVAVAGSSSWSPELTPGVSVTAPVVVEHLLLLLL